MASLLDRVGSNSEAMQQVRKQIEPFIDSTAPILFWGETKSGMGFYARTIHKISQRTGKFLLIPGFSLDEETVKQQFLGIENQPGWLEEAHNGTIFIRRVSETSSAVQQFLLQLIGNQSVNGDIQFPHKGGTESLEVNVRFMYSMVHDFNLAIQDGLVRRDLVDEIKKRGKIIHHPPLRERKEDIIGIAGNFVEQFNQEYHQDISAIDEQAHTIFTRYMWPGNIDELKRVIEGIFAHNPGIRIITEEQIPEYLKNPEISENKYSFKLKDDVKFTGWIRSSSLTIQTESKKLDLKPEDLAEILRVEDTKFAPPRFKHFVFKFKDGSQITGKILDKTMSVETSFDDYYEIITQDLYSVFLL
jgi:DNA-binding NtrC family response regulator